MMTTIETLLQQPAAQVIGWALLHFVWQGALVGGLTAIALAALRQSAADVRYVVATIALSLMVTLPVVTAVQLWRAVSPGPTGKPASIPSGVVKSTGPAVMPARLDSTNAAPAGIPFAGPAAPAARSGALDAVRLEPWLPAVVLLWLCGVAVLSLRLLSGWLVGAADEVARHRSGSRRLAADRGASVAPAPHRAAHPVARVPAG